MNLVAASSLAIFLAAAFFEIAGCFAFWAWLRLGKSIWWLAPGAIALFIFAWLLTFAPTDAAGRAYAVYGGVYIAASLLWLWIVEGQTPDRWDVGGAAVCIIGASIILLAPRTAPARADGGQNRASSGGRAAQLAELGGEIGLSERLNQPRQFAFAAKALALEPIERANAILCSLPHSSRQPWCQLCFPANSAPRSHWSCHWPAGLVLLDQEHRHPERGRALWRRFACRQPGWSRAWS
jgi:small multidrug resistance family-3 protein